MSPVIPPRITNSLGCMRIEQIVAVRNDKNEEDSAGDVLSIDTVK